VHSVVSSLAPHGLTHLGMIEKAPCASKQDFVEIFRQSVRLWRVQCSAGELNALLTQTAVEITTNEFCRVVSMHSLDETVEFAFEVDMKSRSVPPASDFIFSR
jgi:hypothetical protein